MNILPSSNHTTDIFRRLPEWHGGETAMYRFRSTEQIENFSTCGGYYNRQAVLNVSFCQAEDATEA